MKVFGLSIILSIIIGNFSFSQEVVKFRSPYGWKIGDYSEVVKSPNGISVEMEVVKAYIDGENKYIVTFKNYTNRTLEGGARISLDYPENTHFHFKLDPGEEKKWSEILTANVKFIYVLTDIYD